MLHIYTLKDRRVGMGVGEVFIVYRLFCLFDLVSLCDNFEYGVCFG